MNDLRFRRLFRPGRAADVAERRRFFATTFAALTVATTSKPTPFLADESPEEQPSATVATTNDWTEDASRAAGTKLAFELDGARYAMRWAPAGGFEMGSRGGELGRQPEEKRRTVTLTHGFWILETPATLGLWNAVSKNKLRRFSGPNPYDLFPEKGSPEENYPVEMVSWDDAQEFLTKLNERVELPSGLAFRLPTSAEWEYACRAGTTTVFPWGNACDGSQANVDGRFPFDDAVIHSEFNSKWKKPRESTPVASYPPNPWGLYDMIGNVAEWCEDVYDGRTPERGVCLEDCVDPCTTPEKLAASTPANDSGSDERDSPEGASFRDRARNQRDDYYRVRRGGSFNHAPIHSRAASVLFGMQQGRGVESGFRFVAAPF